MQTQTIEFQADIKNGIIHIPKKYNYLQQKAKVVVRCEYPSIQESDVLAFSNSSANTVDEWKDESEDEVWT
jgi:hypothetical protein